MIGLLSLSNDLIELVGKEIIVDEEDSGLEAWCRVTTTCKRLWDMQLPESSSEWLLEMNDDIRSESKIRQLQLAQGNVLCMCKWYHVAMSRCTMDTAANAINKQVVGQAAIR